MSPLHALLLGIIEGITEFLPISSTGHLILASNLLKMPQTEALKSFEIAIQLGAILAVLIVSGRRLLVSKKTMLLVLAAFVPTGIIGFLFKDLVRSVLLESVTTVLGALFIGGIVLIVFEVFHKEKETAMEIEQMTYTQAALIGVFQALALVPGVSRAAATILGGLSLGLKRTAIVEFSFLLAIPTMAIATVVDLKDSIGLFTQDDITALAIGMMVSFITALLAIKWLMRYIQHHSFAPFGWYRMGVAVIVGLLLYI